MDLQEKPREQQLHLQLLAACKSVPFFIDTGTAASEKLQKAVTLYECWNAIDVTVMAFFAFSAHLNHN